MAIRGVKVDHATIQSWVFKFTPLLEKEFNQRKKIVGKRSFSKIKVRQCKYLNNIVEQDHRFIKKRIINGLGFKEFEPAKRTLSGIEMVHMIKKEQLISNRKSMFKSFYSLAA